MMKNGAQLEEIKKQGKKLDIKEMMDLFKIEIKISIYNIRNKSKTVYQESRFFG